MTATFRNMHQCIKYLENLGYRYLSDDLYLNSDMTMVARIDIDIEKIMSHTITISRLESGMEFSRKMEVIKSL